MLDSKQISTMGSSEFFSMETNYLVAPDATVEQLMNDSSNLMVAAIDILNSCGGLTDATYGAMYLMRQAKATHDEANSLLMKSGAFKD
jgi:hypothetical protein